MLEALGNNQEEQYAEFTLELRLRPPGLSDNVAIYRKYNMKAFVHKHHLIQIVILRAGNFIVVNTLTKFSRPFRNVITKIFDSISHKFIFFYLQNPNGVPSGSIRKEEIRQRAS